MALKGRCGSTFQPGLLLASVSVTPQAGHLLLADTPQSRGTAADGISPASFASSHVTHSSAILIQPSITAFADGYFATFCGARAIASSLKSVRLSFSGHSGWRTIDGTVVAGREAGEAGELGSVGAPRATVPTNRLIAITRLAVLIVWSPFITRATAAAISTLGRIGD